MTTNIDPSACGFDLPTTPKPILLFGTLSNSTSPASMSVTSCGYNVFYDALTHREMDFLEMTENPCTGQCYLDNKAHCFVRPCAVSACNVAGATCVDNYCGGCHALWYNQQGSSVCGDSVDTTCTQSGGTVQNNTRCCMNVGDFPNTCLIGSCACAPSNSHVVQTCKCPQGQCFDGEQCTSDKKKRRNRRRN